MIWCFTAQGRRLLDPEWRPSSTARCRSSPSRSGEWLRTRASAVAWSAWKIVPAVGESPCPSGIEPASRRTQCPHGRSRVQTKPSGNSAAGSPRPRGTAPPYRRRSRNASSLRPRTRDATLNLITVTPSYAERTEMPYRLLGRSVTDKQENICRVTGARRNCERTRGPRRGASIGPVDEIPTTTKCTEKGSCYFDCMRSRQPMHPRTEVAVVRLPQVEMNIIGQDAMDQILIAAAS